MTTFYLIGAPSQESLSLLISLIVFLTEWNHLTGSLTVSTTLAPG